MIMGQCLCGKITYQYKNVIEKTIICFCIDCQKAQGAFGGWNSAIDKNKFEIMTGQAYLKEYFHTASKARVFCSQCASPIYSYRKDLPNIIRLRLGTVTQGIIPDPIDFAYIGNKAGFLKINSAEE